MSEFDKVLCNRCNKCGTDYPVHVFQCPVCNPQEMPNAVDQNPYPAINTQEGGDHYKSMKIQPVEYIHANNIGYCEGAVIKYVSRWKRKGGIEDLRKAKHFIDLLIELET